MNNGMRELGGWRLLAISAALISVAALLGAGPALAKEARLLKPPVGNLTEPKGVAVDQGSHDVYVIGGRSEEQVITVSATTGNFKLKLEGSETPAFKFNATSEELRT